MNSDDSVIHKIHVKNCKLDVSLMSVQGCIKSCKKLKDQIQRFVILQILKPFDNKRAMMALDRSPEKT